MIAQPTTPGWWRADRNSELFWVSWRLYFQGRETLLKSEAWSLGARECAIGYPKRKTLGDTVDISGCAGVVLMPEL